MMSVADCIWTAVVFAMVCIKLWMEHVGSFGIDLCVVESLSWHWARILIEWVNGSMLGSLKFVTLLMNLW